ncbi:hypothetical protein Pcinc_024695 [Petrolisthes cinctipes]|uniref:Uncharacterized protein n=1 Tax=Petrolisthes cinctipes TaxID=88211 RepID=A0AAE1F9F2_PETCI|nr:hypothetical protein Pcinc_024695 [Petrolisthes cinctipes]
MESDHNRNLPHDIGDIVNDDSSSEVPLSDIEPLLDPFFPSDPQSTPMSLTQSLPFPSASLTTDEHLSLPSSYNSPMSLNQSLPLPSTSLTTDEPFTIPFSQPSTSSSSQQPFSLPHLSSAFLSGTEDSGGIHWCGEQGNLTPVFPSLPLNPHVSFSVNPSQVCDPYQGSGGHTEAWVCEAWEPEHLPIESWASPGLTTQENEPVPSSPGHESQGQPGISSRQPWLKLKMYQWPEQKDPQLEKKRLRAIKQNELRMREKNEELEMRLLIARTIQENERYKEEKAKLQARINWLNQMMKHKDTFDDMSPKPGSSTM